MRFGSLTCGLCLVASLAAAMSMPAIAQKYFYRYVNDKGVVVHDDHVPPEFVKNGYSVLTPDGRVVEEVPRQLSGDEGKRQREAALAAERARRWDETLLRRYSSVADIEAARDRAVRDYQVRIGILRSNLLSTKSQIERERAAAADLERRGSDVPPSLLDTIARLQAEVDENEAAVAQRESEVEQLKARFQRDIERFVELNDVVEWRRARQAGGDG